MQRGNRAVVWNPARDERRAPILDLSNAHTHKEQAHMASQPATHIILRPGAESPEIAYDGPPDFGSMADLVGGTPVEVVTLKAGMSMYLYEKGEGDNAMAARLADKRHDNPRGIAVVASAFATPLSDDQLATVLSETA
jgi:hypothetical protein